MINTIIIGAGPAGLMCANELENSNSSYLILEKNSSPGKKLLITGGGRCNVTNILGPSDFISSLTFKNKRFLYSSISKFTTNDVIDFFSKREISLSLTEDFFYFPSSQKSSDILDALLKDIDENKISFNEEVKSIDYIEDIYHIVTNNRKLMAKNLVVATGGSSYPKTGSTGDGVKFAKKLELKTVPFYPAESSLKSNFISSHKDVFQGITLLDKSVKIQGEKEEFHGNILFTHFGLSGPAILGISEFVYHKLNNKNEVYLTFNISDLNLDEYKANQLEFSESQKTLKSFLESMTVKRLANYILKSLDLEATKKVRETSKKDLNLIMENIINFKVKINDTLSISSAFVNGGGISLKELSSTSFESKKYPGLYFIGETIDAHGPIGGFNITIAFSSGISAARDIIKE